MNRLIKNHTVSIPIIKLPGTCTANNIDEGRRGIKEPAYFHGNKRRLHVWTTFTIIEG